MKKRFEFEFSKTPSPPFFKKFKISSHSKEVYVGVVIEGLGAEFFIDQKCYNHTKFVTNITSFDIGKIMVEIMIRQW